jgi:hypothetical protein
MARDRCYDFKNIFAEKIAKKLQKNQNKAKLFKCLNITLDFEKNASFFAENWQNRLNFDHNIDPSK